MMKGAMLVVDNRGMGSVMQFLRLPRISFAAEMRADFPRWAAGVVHGGGIALVVPPRSVQPQGYLCVKISEKNSN
jgi:hypothetical protein